MLRAVSAALLGLATLVSLAGISRSGQAGATQVSGTVTYSASVKIAAPPPSNFSGSAGGDGWAVALSTTQVFNVFHHQDTVQVACHNQSDASACWAPETIVDGSGNNFASSGQPGLYLSQTTGDLYVFATRTSDFTAGVLCINTALAASATGAQRFCGFTALSTVGDGPLQGGISGASDPVIVGTNWYSFNTVDGTPTGTQDQLMCFSLTTFAACPSQPYPVDSGGGDNNDPQYPSPSIAVFAGQIVIPIVAGSTPELACFDTATLGNCVGSWPVDNSADGYPSYDSAGAPFPLLSTGGETTGFCIPDAVQPCFDLSGNPVTAPAGLAAVITENYNWNGPATVIGGRIYVPMGPLNEVACYDFTVDAQCANFPKVFSNLSLLYTVNTDPQRPTCLWVNSDSGADQIQDFDAYTGGVCGAGSTRVLASSIVASGTACVPANYTSLRVTSPAPNTYTNGTVDFEDFDGNPIPGIPQGTLDNTGKIDLTSLGLSTKSSFPQFLVSLNGEASSPAYVDVTLTWTGTYSPSCLTGDQVVVSGQGYRLGGSDGGIFDFGSSQFYGSMTGKHLNAPEVGIAATNDDRGYWLAASDGGVFAFGDADFYGSKGGDPLNAPVVAIASTPDGKGYWLTAADGGVFTYGDAGFYGSKGGDPLNTPVVAIASTPDGKGYWLTAADGGVFAFGDAAYHGSKVGSALDAPVVGIASSASGNGYWLVASDGGVFAYGDAPYLGNMVGNTLDGPMVGIQPTPDRDGYWIDATDGGVFAFGDAQFLGSLPSINMPPEAPIDSIGS